MGSVKDLTVLEKATVEKLGVGIFNFSDRYSAFDYGEMPDHIPGKGAALCKMSSYNFQELEKLGFKTHFIEQPSENEMKVKIVRVLDPAKNELQGQKTNHLVPLEIIYRNSLPEGSSLFKRFEKGEVKPEDFGLTEVPEAGVKLSEPLLDVSTKLEKRDRYLPWGEAQQLAQLSDEQLTEIKKLTLKVNDFVTQHAEKVGLEHADGKIEFAVDEQGDLILVDVFGTPDENRFLYQGTHLSKQVLRNYYKKLPWHAEFLEKGFEHKPPKADPKLISLVSDMYKSVCNVWCQDSTFDVPKMSEVVQRYKEYLNNN